ncbi:siphovirus Gp157 family protein [Aureimonas glaciei]|uniref:Siphovirus Gp157 family protein n=1 Tax=Aureimonas glaciei TaxID=1776957 RepID=A0A917D968_9HYPH|nr:siphovirus Gp157 family protein [Aureimonas glaciei]GGD11838.1 hypothetical protein GCM10011335_13510 [Aureimonas glaciei]
MDDPVRKLQREKVAAIRLMSHLRDAGEADDAEIVETAIEGETNFVEAVASVVAEIDECEVLQIGLKAKIEDFGNRLAAVTKRSEMLRAAIEASMVEAEQRNVKLPTKTVFLSERGPNVVVENEAEIPSRFWVQPEAPAPRLDRNALKAALKAKEVIPGAKLDNGSVSLSMRK